MTTQHQGARSTLADVVWLVPLSFVVIVGTFFTGAGGEPGHRPEGSVSGLAALCAVVAVAALFLALKRPLAGVLLNAAAVVAFLALPLQDGPIYLTLAAAAFLAASRLPQRRWLPILGPCIGLISVVMLARGIWNDDVQRGLWQPVASLGIVTAGAAIGSLLRSRREARAERAQRVATEEQLRMAQDLHDGVGHGLAVIAMQAGVALHVLDRDPAAARASLEAIRDTSRESLAALRAELSTLAGEPAARRPRRGLDELDVLVDRVRAAGPTVEVRRANTTTPVPDGVDSAAYAILQEALTNVLRHAEASAVTVGIDQDADTLTVTVTDDGQGGEVQDEGMGLSGMRDRATELGGTTTAGPRPGGGFEVRAVLPLETR